MNNKSFFGLLLISLIFSFTILNCSPGGVANVTITIDLGLHNKAAFNAPESSIFDRVLRFFAKDAEAQAYTPNIISLTLNITGSGMSTITKTYTAPVSSSITVEVPAGGSRTFEVTASTASVTFRGTATRSLAGGETVSIPISMTLYETKIMIPDPRNGRIVQIDNNFSIPNWIAKNVDSDPDGLYLMSISLSMLTPYDIDFDSQGRIYIGNNESTDGTIIRIDDINDTIPEKLAAPGGYTITTLAIDRNNNDLIYFATSNTLYSCTFDWSFNQTITLPGINFNEIRGLAVDDSGNLYIAAHAGTVASLPYVFKCDPSQPSNFTYYDTDLTTPWDVIVKGNYLYIANYDESGSNDKIIQLNLGLGYEDELINPQIGTDSFKGPHRFIAILNNRFCLIDERENDGINDDERLVAFDNFDSAWDSFIPTVAQGYFHFFGSC